MEPLVNQHLQRITENGLPKDATQLPRVAHPDRQTALVITGMIAAASISRNGIVDRMKFRLAISVIRESVSSKEAAAAMSLFSWINKDKSNIYRARHSKPSLKVSRSPNETGTVVQAEFGNLLSTFACPTQYPLALDRTQNLFFVFHFSIASQQSPRTPHIGRSLRGIVSMKRSYEFGISSTSCFVRVFDQDDDLRTEAIAPPRHRAECRRRCRSTARYRIIRACPTAQDHCSQRRRYCRTGTLA